MSWRIALASRFSALPIAHVSRRGTAVLLLLVIVLTGFLVLRPAPNRTPDATELSGIRLGEKAPLFTLGDTTGQHVSLAQFRGRAVLLNFWSTSCAPCTQEMPVLQRALDQLTRMARVRNTVAPTIVGIDATTESAATLRRFAQHLGVRYALLLDPRLQVTLLTYHVADIPSSVVVDPAGRVSFVHVGALNEHEILGALGTAAG